MPGSRSDSTFATILISGRRVAFSVAVPVRDGLHVEAQPAHAGQDPRSELLLESRADLETLKRGRRKAAWP